METFLNIYAWISMILTTIIILGSILCLGETLYKYFKALNEIIDSHDLEFDEKEEEKSKPILRKKVKAEEK